MARDIRSACFYYGMSKESLTILEHHNSHSLQKTAIISDAFSYCATSTFEFVCLWGKSNMLHGQSYSTCFSLAFRRTFHRSEPYSLGYNSRLNQMLYGFCCCCFFFSWHDKGEILSVSPEVNLDFTKSILALSNLTFCAYLSNLEESWWYEGGLVQLNKKDFNTGK